jgi:hypothetical protein
VRPAVERGFPTPGEDAIATPAKHLVSSRRGNPHRRDVSPATRGKRARVLATFQLTIGPREKSAPAGGDACFVAAGALSTRVPLVARSGSHVKVPPRHSPAASLDARCFLVEQLPVVRGHRFEAAVVRRGRSHRRQQERAGGRFAPLSLDHDGNRWLHAAIHVMSSATHPRRWVETFADGQSRRSFGGPRRARCEQYANTRLTLRVSARSTEF